jgi:Tfp pilus assembly protein PilN
MKVINLLPQSEQKNLQQEKLSASLRKFLISSAISYGFIILLLVGWRFYLQGTLANVDSDIKKNQALINRQDNDILRKQVQKINNIDTDYLNLAKVNPQWSKILLAFKKLVPNDVLITSLNANTKTGKIDIIGVGLSRDSVLALRTNIANSPVFQNVNLPLENLQKANNVVFNYSFFIADGALTK